MNTPSSHAVSFGVYPPVTRIITAPRALVKSPISVFNNSNDTVQLSIVLKAFRPSEAENGTIQYYTVKDTPSDVLTFLSTVKIEDKNEEVKQINLAPKEYKSLTITFPAPVVPHDEYFSVIFLGQAKEEKTDETVVHIATGVAGNVLVSPEKAVSVILITPELKTKPFILHSPVRISLKLTNNSDNFISTSGTISVYDIFGKKTAQLALKPAIILADSSRTITGVNTSEGSEEIAWNEKFLMGYYTIKASVAINKTTTQTYETHFVAVPLLALIFCTLTLFILLSILYKALRKLNFKET